MMHPPKPRKTTPSKTKPIRQYVEASLGSGIKTGDIGSDEVKDQFMNNLNELLRAEGKEITLQKENGDAT